MIASATAEDYRRAIQAVAEDPSVDALVVIFIPRIAATPEAVAHATDEAARSLPRKIPVLAVFMSAQGAPAALDAGDLRIPAYAFPEAAAIALARAVRYGEWRSRPVGEPARPEGLRRDEAAALVATALRRGDGWLTPEETRQLLACYDLRLVAQRVVADPAGAGSAAEDLGGRVALKGLVPGIVHKTELGAVRLGLEGTEAVRCAAEEMQALLGAKGYSPSAFLVQEMAPEGVEMLVGLIQDPHFGPVVACGAGGVMVELLRDVSVRLAPLTRADATEMIQSLKTYPLLTGFRGRPACDVGMLEDALARVSALAADLPQVAELDLNPIIVHPDGAALVDARIRVAPSAPPRPIGARG
jgi:acyl-CoA synthetase (NDP forming)